MNRTAVAAILSMTLALAPLAPALAQDVVINADGSVTVNTPPAPGAQYTAQLPSGQIVTLRAPIEGAVVTTTAAPATVTATTTAGATTTVAGAGAAGVGTTTTTIAAGGLGIGSAVAIGGLLIGTIVAIASASDTN